jgi:urea transport system ATP-binding protein
MKLLELQDITVLFDGFKALDNFNFSLDKGAVRVVIGPNGAGKSTMCDTIIGKVRPTLGKVIYNDKDISKTSEHDIVRLGICRKFQTPGVLENLSAEDNLAVGVRKRKGWWFNVRSGLTGTETHKVNEVLELVGLSDKRNMPASQLAHGEKQWLEIGMVIAADPELLLLDEPTAGMTAQETEKTARLISGLAGKHTVLVIDHDMSFVELLDAPVSVMHQGKLFKEGSIQNLRDDPAVVEIYLGRAKEGEKQQEEREKR